MEVTVTRVRHRWAERAGFALNRPQGTEEYILLHFLTPVELTFHGQTFPVDHGSFIVFSPGTPHGFVAHEPLFHDWLHLTGDMTSLMNRYGLAPDTLYSPDQSAGVSEIVAFLEMEFFAQKTYWHELALSKLQEMLIRISHSVSGAQPQLRVRDETAEHLREIRTRILSSPWRSWSIPELAQAVSLSQSRLHAVYKTVFGVSPRHDLILIRIEKAKTLLHSGSSVAAAAEQLGYASVYHFIRQFKQFTGQTPKQYSRHSGSARETDK